MCVPVPIAKTPWKSYLLTGPFLPVCACLYYGCQRVYYNKERPGMGIGLLGYWAVFGEQIGQISYWRTSHTVKRCPSSGT
jgi:hypothetical protein